MTKPEIDIKIKSPCKHKMSITEINKLVDQQTHYKIGSKPDDAENPYADEKNIFTAPVDGTYKWTLEGIKLVKRLKKGESINLDKYKEQDK